MQTNTLNKTIRTMTVLAAVAASILLPAVVQATEYLFYEPFDQFTSDTPALLAGGVGVNQWYKGYFIGPPAGSGISASGKEGHDAGPIYHAASPPPGINPNSGWTTTAGPAGMSGALFSRPIITTANHPMFTLDFKYREDNASHSASYSEGVGIGPGSLVGGDTIHFNGDAPTLLFVVNPNLAQGSKFKVYVPTTGNNWWGGAPWNYATYTGGSYADATTYELRLQALCDGTAANDQINATYRAFDPATGWGAWQDITGGWQTAGRDLDGLSINALQVWDGDYWGASTMIDDIYLDNVIPEPGVFSLLALGGAFMVWRRRVAAKRA